MPHGATLIADVTALAEAVGVSFVGIGPTLSAIEEQCFGAAGPAKPVAVKAEAADAPMGSAAAEEAEASSDSEVEFVGSQTEAERTAAARLRAEREHDVLELPDDDEGVEARSASGTGVEAPTEEKTRKVGPVKVEARGASGAVGARRVPGAKRNNWGKGENLVRMASAVNNWFSGGKFASGMDMRNYAKTVRIPFETLKHYLHEDPARRRKLGASVGVKPLVPKEDPQVVVDAMDVMRHHDRGGDTLSISRALEYAPNGCMLFMLEMRRQNPDLPKGQEGTTAMKKMWRNLGDDGKKVWTDRAEPYREEYWAKLDEYNRNRDDFFVHQQIHRASRKRTKIALPRRLECFPSKSESSALPRKLECFPSESESSDSESDPSESESSDSESDSDESSARPAAWWRAALARRPCCGTAERGA